MGFGVIGNLVADARREDEYASVSKPRLQFTIQTEQDVTLLAPMIGQVIRRVFNHPDTDGAKLLRTRQGRSGNPVVSRRLDRRPVGESKTNVINAHRSDARDLRFWWEVSSPRRGTGAKQE